MARPQNWREIVADAAVRNKMSDPRLLFALLEAENGADDREFGYGVQDDGTVPEKWRGFTKQAGAAAFQIRREEEEYAKETGRSPLWHGLYTKEFLEYFSSGSNSTQIAGPPEGEDPKRPGRMFGFPKVELYPGYAPVGAANDPKGLNVNHLPNLTSAYAQMTKDPRNGQTIPAEVRQAPQTSSVPPEADRLDFYAKARTWEDELADMAVNLGKQTAEKVRALHEVDVYEAARKGQMLTQPITSYLGEKFGDAMDLMAWGGRMVRGFLGGEPGTEMSAEELTGLEPEVMEHSPSELLAGGPLGGIIQYPNRAANFGVELMTDPLNTLGAGVSGVAKVAGGLKGLAGGVGAVGTIKKVGEGAKDVKGVTPAIRPGEPLPPRIETERLPTDALMEKYPPDGVGETGPFWVGKGGNVQSLPPQATKEELEALPTRQVRVTEDAREVIEGAPSAEAPAQPGGGPTQTTQPTGSTSGPVPPQEEGLLLRRWDPPGTPQTGKPRGLYTTPVGGESPHAEPGMVETLYRLDPSAKILDTTTKDADVIIRKGAIGAGAGVHAAKQLLGDETFEALRQGTKAEAIAFGEQRYPGVDFSSRIYDKQDVIEVIGAQEAKAQGYDAIRTPESSGLKIDLNFDEVVILNDSKAKVVPASSGGAAGGGTPPPGGGTPPTAPPPPPPPPSPPSPVPGMSQADLDNLLKSVQAGIAEARKSKIAISAEATALLESKAVTVKKVLAGDFTVGDPSTAQAVQAIRQEWMRQLDTAMTGPLPRTPAEEKKLRGLLKLNAQLDKQIRSKLEIPAGQTVQAARFGQGPGMKALEETFELSPEGTPLEGLLYTYRMLKGAKEKAAWIKEFGKRGSRTRGALTQIMLNSLIAGTGTPIWNAAAMTSMTTAKVFERWRMSRFVDSNTVPGEAGVLAQSLMSSYWRLLWGDAKVTERFQENWKKVKALGQGVDQRQIDRMQEIPREMSLYIQVDPKTKARSISNPQMYEVLVKEYEALKESMGVGGLNKFQVRRTISKESYDATGLWGAAIDAVGHTINIPTYVVGGVDALFRFAIQTAYADTMAFRTAYQNTLMGLKAGEKMTDPAAKARFTQLRQQYLDHPESVHARYEGRMVPLNEIGREQADLVSMMAPLEGRLQAIDTATRDSLAFRTFLPFFRVQMLTAREAGARLPLVNRLLPSVRADLMAGGERAARAKAQIGSGWAVAGLSVMLNQMGVCDGNGPTDPDARKDWEEAGHRSYTCRIPSGEKDGRQTYTYIPYDRAAPIGNVFGFMMDMAYMLPRLDTAAGDAGQSLGLTMAEEAAEAMMVAGTHLMMSNITAGDFRDLMSALAEGEGAADKVGSVLARKTPGFVPFSALGRQINMLLDGELKASDSVWERMQRVIPGMSKTLPAYHSKWGEKGEVPMEGAWDFAAYLSGSQVRSLDPKDPRHALQETMDRSRVTFSGPGKVQMGVRLNVHQHERLKELFGKGIYDKSGRFIRLEERQTAQQQPPDGDSLTSLLWGVVHGHDGQAPIEWERGNPGPDGARQQLVTRAATALKDAAMKQLLKEDLELLTQVLNQKGYRAVGPMSPEQVESAIDREQRGAASQLRIGQ